ncbi:MAG: hypothetical protein JRJ20_15755 [Deltaproteobacteria bacterium]|nr:hypothetical protein [Deltaproteobacteria bacterium]
MSLTIKRSAVIYQQDVECLVSLKNTGSSPILMGFPPVDQSMPIVLVSRMSTGAKQQYQRSEDSTPHFLGDFTLAPGEALENSFSLWNIVPSLSPDEYDIAVLWQYDNAGRTAESNSVRLSVLPNDPKNLRLVDAVGGQGAFRFGVWLNTNSNPPVIFRSGFSFSPGEHVQGILEVAAACQNSQPVLAAPIPGSSLNGHWVAWIDGNVVCYTHIDKKLGVLPVRHFPLSSGQWEIVPPLYGETALNFTQRSDGGMLLCGRGETDENFKLVSVQFLNGEAKIRADTPLPGTKPLWTKSHVLESGERFLTYLQFDGENVALYLVSWPGTKGSLHNPKRLSAWNGKFLGANAGVSQNSEIRGGILLQGGKDNSNIELVNWSLRHDNPVLKEKKQVINWFGDRQITSAKIGISDTGRLTVTIKSGEGFFYGSDSEGKLKKIPEEVTKDLLVYEIGFAGGEGEPVLITGSDLEGFRVLQFDGSPLPLTSSPKGKGRK